MEGVMGEVGFKTRKPAIEELLSDHPRQPLCITPPLIHLLTNLLLLDPTKRTTAAEALDDGFFFESGDIMRKPEELDMTLGGIGDVHEWDARGKKGGR